MNSFGRILKVTLYGTSHNTEIGIVIDGCPAGIGINPKDFENDLARRSPKTLGTTSRIEEDTPIIKSGVYNGYTNGSPLVISFLNKNINTSDYNFEGFYRPGHADLTSYIKYNGYNDPNGGGQSSGRMTLPIVAAGVVAKKIINNIVIQGELLTTTGPNNIEDEIKKAYNENNSIGGIVICNVSGVPIGLGEPFFDSIESLISHAIFSIPGAKAIEFGEGIKSSQMKGSEFNDMYINKEGKTHTNNNGGINGGISNGNDIYFKVYFKPTPSIGKSQTTLNFVSNDMQNFEIKGRHDVCYAIRTPVIVEALTALVIADLFLLSK